MADRQRRGHVKELRVFVLDTTGSVTTVRPLELLLGLLAHLVDLGDLVEIPTAEEVVETALGSQANAQGSRTYESMVHLGVDSQLTPPLPKLTRLDADRRTHDRELVLQLDALQKSLGILFIVKSLKRIHGWMIKPTRDHSEDESAVISEYVDDPVRPQSQPLTLRRIATKFFVLSYPIVDSEVPLTLL